jgi:F-type H+-transporting ATPase subunit delta
MSDLITIARPYARAVFETAAEAKSRSAWSKALELLTALVSHTDVRAALDNPALTKTQKADLLIETVKDSLSPEAQNLLRVMADNGRLALIPEVTALYEQMCAADEGSIEAELTSAFEISDEQQKTIAASLKKRLGRDVRLNVRIDPELLGGVIVRAGDLVIDGSIRGRLEKLTGALAR